MKKVTIINLVFCILLSCNIRNQGEHSSLDKQTNEKTVFLGFVLGSSHTETKDHINLLLNKGKIKRSNSFSTLGLKENDVFEYPFFVKNKDYTSIFSVSLNSKNELLKLIRIEIQDSEKTIHVKDLCSLLREKYGNPNDSTLSYQISTFPDEYKTYCWNLVDRKITLKREYSSNFIKKHEETTNFNEDKNIFSITFEEVKLSNKDMMNQLNNDLNRIEEGKKRIKNDL